MIPISKQIINNKQKRAAQRVARFLRLQGSWFLYVFYGLFYLLFATRQKSRYTYGGDCLEMDGANEDL